jgi:predicted outer membrane repeat protein
MKQKMNYILNLEMWLVISLLWLELPATALDGRIIYVDSDAMGANDGSSWENAHNNLQDAISAAAMEDEIRVAQGTYTPLGSFILKSSVAILGSYAGFGAPDPNARDIEGLETVLSGKVDHIVWSENTNGSAILDGFTIMGGQGAGIPRNGGPVGGGGIYNIAGSPMIRNCTFIGNSSSNHGGGMANVDGSSPTLINCTFECNYSLYHGGGIYSKNSILTLINCRFINNVSDNGHGGGIYALETSLFLRDCSFVDNRAKRDGGAIVIERAHPSATIQNCVFTSNTADIGGGMATERMGSVLVENCIFAGNTAWRGSAIVGGRLTNCTLTGNKAHCLSAAETATLNNCIVWGNLEGDPDECFWFVGGNAGGSIFVDPCFANIGYWDPNGTPEDPIDDFWIDGDYHLKSQAVRWDPNTQTWVKDDVTSPCIDAGDPMSPIGLEPFPNGGRINMGAYGGTSEASKSYFGEPICETIIAGDINGDCKVDFKDLALLATHWIANSSP